MTVDLRVVEPDQFGNLLQHFTGSKAHNMAAARGGGPARAARLEYIVRAVAPTYINTPLNAFVKSNPAMYEAWIGGTPMAWLGEVQEIAFRRAVLRLRRRELDDRLHCPCRWRLYLLVVRVGQGSRGQA